MSTESTSSEQPLQLPIFNLIESRVLGVLIEKAKTTPDSYPLTINSLITGCNQKSNRDPVLNVNDLDVEEALNNMKSAGLVIRISGSGRVEKWRHNVYDAWNVNKYEISILAELLLRGAQTEGELRSRVSRMEEIEDLESLRSILGKLAERKMVVYLTPMGKRGTMVTHGFQPQTQLEKLKQRYAGAGGGSQESEPLPVAASPKSNQIAQFEGDLAKAQQEITELKSIVGELRDSVTHLKHELNALKESLGG